MAKIQVGGHVGNVALRKVNTKNGEKTVLDISVADSSLKKDSGIDPWYRVTLWDKYAETMCQYISKGTGIFVSGDLVVSTYTSKDGNVGVQKSIDRAEIVLISRSETSSNNTAPASAPTTATTTAPVQTQAQPQMTAPVDMGFMDIPDGVLDELPFT